MKQSASDKDPFLQLMEQLIRVGDIVEDGLTVVSTVGESIDSLEW